MLASAFAIVTSLYGAVDLDESLVLGATLAALIFGLVPFAVTLVQMRVFYAMKDARTPTLINAIMVAVRVPLLIACATLDTHPDRARDWPWPRRSPTWSARSPGRSGCASGTGRCAPSGRCVTLIKMTIAGAAGAGAVLLVSERVLRLEVDDLGEALLQLVVGGVVGLVVIAAVALLLRVEELVPVRRRIAASLGRVFRRGGAARRAARADDSGRFDGPVSHQAGRQTEHALAAEETLPVLAGASATADETLPVIAAAAQAAAEESAPHVAAAEEPAPEKTSPVAATPSSGAASALAIATGGPRHARDASGPVPPARHGTLGGDRPAHASGGDGVDGSVPGSGAAIGSGPTSREQVSVANDSGGTIAAEGVLAPATPGSDGAESADGARVPTVSTVARHPTNRRSLSPASAAPSRRR